ncbi:unnamed protein product, partial [marine sediment metagenome]
MNAVHARFGSCQQRVGTVCPADLAAHKAAESYVAVFTYQALSQSAQDVRGTIAAESPREAREKLRAQGTIVETIEQQRSISVLSLV